MYEYKFERIDTKLFSSAPARDYHEIVERRAREGWRLVQIFAPSAILPGGAAGYYELIFEKEVAGA
jgi:hypothetical protein